MNVEEKWKANREKVAFAKSFPGLTDDLESIQGKVLEKVVPTKNQTGHLLIFSEGEFIFIPAAASEPSKLLQALEEGRPWLESFHQKAYQTLDALTQRDRELQRKARLEKLLSAVKHNYATIPEIKEELQKLLNELN